MLMKKEIFMKMIRKLEKQTKRLDYINQVLQKICYKLVNQNTI